MTVTISFLEGGPDFLRYLATAAASSPPVVTATIGNAGGATPDLLTDIQSVLRSWEGQSGPGSIKAIVDAGRNGYGPIGTSLTQAEARALLAGEDPGNLVPPTLPKCVLKVFPRTAAAGAAVWTADVNVAAGQPVIVVAVETDETASTAVVELRLQHTERS